MEFVKPLVSLNFVSNIIFQLVQSCCDPKNVSEEIPRNSDVIFQAKINCLKLTQYSICMFVPDTQSSRTLA